MIAVLDSKQQNKKSCVGTNIKRTSSYGASHQSQPAQAMARIPFGPETFSTDWGHLQKQPHTPQLEKKSASDLTQQEAVREETRANISISAVAKTAMGFMQQPSAPTAPSPLKKVVTPLRRPQFEEELKKHPDPLWVKQLLHGIDKGVRLGYKGPRFHHTSRNLSSASRYPHIIDKEIDKEISLGRLLGPFDDPPFSNLRCSGVGVIPKKTGGWRMIMHLSAPTRSSINDGINKEEFTLRYSSIDDAVRLIQLSGPTSKLAKIDIKSAFRTIPVCCEDRELLGIRWRNKYYVDCCLPFGLRSAPCIFNRFAEALEWILRNNYGITKVLHYLDDFLVVGQPDTDKCEQAMATTLQVCQKLGFPVALEKLEGPATILTFLGILLDTEKMELRLPEDKLTTLSLLLQEWQNMKKKVTKRELLSIIGKLSFAAKVIPAGRLFLRRLIDLSTTAKQLHHHIRLTASARADIQWWLEFLPSWNGVSLMLKASWEADHDINLTTDASGTIGYGAFFDGDWLAGKWTQHQAKRSIQWKELFAILAATAAWGHKWHKRKILIHCDNQAIVQAWQSKSPKDQALAKLFRKLFFLAAKGNFNIALKHLPGVNNQIADALSRAQVDRFRILAPKANLEATTTPAWLIQL